MSSFFNKFIIFICLISVHACGDDNDPDCVLGPVVTDDRTVPDFSGVSFLGIGNIFLTQGTPQVLSISTHEGLLDDIETSVNNNVLTIVLDTDDCPDLQIDELDIFITTPNINFIELEGIGNLISQGDIESAEMRINLTGIGDINLEGAVGDLTINSSGIGNVNTFDLVSETCTVTLTGIGNINVTATSELDVSITGSGNVSFRGDPSINVQISGSGQLLDAN